MILPSSVYFCKVSFDKILPLNPGLEVEFQRKISCKLTFVKADLVHKTTSHGSYFLLAETLQVTHKRTPVAA